MNEVQKEQETKVVVQRRYFPSLLYICLGILVHIWCIGHEFASMSLWSPVVILLWPFYLIIKFFGWFFTAGIFWIAGITVVCFGLYWCATKWDERKRKRARQAREAPSITQI